MKDDKLYLIHISECIERVEKYVGEGGRDARLQLCSRSRASKTPIVRA
jgi:uncharacterized protein with HEPN domain